MARPIRPILGALLLAGAVAGCSSDDTVDPPAEFITARRAWLPGERQALIDSIIAKQSFVFPYAGNISSLAPQIYADTDSVVVLVPNPAFSASLTAPVPRLANLVMFNSAWTFVGVKITDINTSQSPPDTTFWHLTVWNDPADAGTHGYAIAFSRNTTFSVTVNSTSFDASGGRSTTNGGAGELHTSTATFWEDIGSGGSFQITAENFAGAYSNITTGPYLGGQSRAGTMAGRIRRSTFARVFGTEAPTSFSVNFDFRATPLPATEILCVFPAPCTTNTLREAVR